LETVLKSSDLIVFETTLLCGNVVSNAGLSVTGSNKVIGTRHQAPVMPKPNSKFFLQTTSGKVKVFAQ